MTSTNIKSITGHEMSLIKKAKNFEAFFYKNHIQTLYSTLFKMLFTRNDCDSLDPITEYEKINFKAVIGSNVIFVLLI